MHRTFRTGLTLFACIYVFTYMRTYTDWHFIDNVDLIFHEAGHTIFSFFGEWIQIAAGSAFQIALPAFISGYFFVHKQRISGALCLLWVGINLLNVSVYAGDAIAMQLPLLGGDASIHDWNYLLTSMGILRYASLVAVLIRMTGFIAICTGTVLALLLSWRDDVATQKNDSTMLGGLS